MNVGDIHVTVTPTTIALRMGHPMAGRHEALITHNEARTLAELLLRLAREQTPFKGLFD